LIFATIASLAALVSGDFNARMVARQQPAKLAAFEGHFTTGPADLTLVGLPDEDGGRMRHALAIPGGLSLLVHHDAAAPVIGLDKVPRQYWPPVSISFVSFHVMAGLGVAFIALTLLASFLRWRGTLFGHRWLLWVFVFAVVGPFAANELGWVAAEVGRQPWIVHPPVVHDAAGQPALDAAGMIQYRLEEGLLTRDAVSDAVGPNDVLASIVMFGVVYALLFWVWLYVLNAKIEKGPEPVVIQDSTRRRDFLAAAAGRTLHEDTMSEAKATGPDVLPER
jgi:cytochrome d ubiquinol oxidase subunit I